MPSIWIPPPLRDLTGGLGVIWVPGATVRQALENVEKIHPGVWGRLCRGDDLSPEVALVVDGEESELRMHHPLQEDSEVHFVPAVSGGAPHSTRNLATAARSTSKPRPGRPLGVRKPSWKA